VYYNWAVTKGMQSSFMEATASTNQIDKFSLYKGQVAITKDSETRHDIGIPCYIADDFENVVLGYHCALITPNPEKLDGRYLNAFLNSKVAKEYFANNASGSGQRYALGIDAIKDIPLYLPSIQEQRFIGKLFADIDRKIASNRVINRNLEAMAKQLYDYWFVQFDFPDKNGKPYKSSGGKMVWNNRLKREIPEEWDNAILKDFLVIGNGKDHKSLPDGNYPVYGSGGYMRSVNRYLYDGESVLLPRKGSLSNFMYVNEAFWTVDTMFYTQEKVKGAAKYIFYGLGYIDISRYDSGTGVPSMTSIAYYDMPFVMPSHSILKVFNDIVTPWMNMIKSNKLKVKELTRQRNELLPLLMNGQISVTPPAINCDL
jgi:type I restriction enzyme S subunit